MNLLTGSISWFRYSFPEWEFNKLQSPLSRCVGYVRWPLKSSLPMDRRCRWRSFCGRSAVWFIYLSLPIGLSPLSVPWSINITLRRRQRYAAWFAHSFWIWFRAHRLFYVRNSRLTRIIMWLQVITSGLAMTIHWCSGALPIPRTADTLSSMRQRFR